MTRVRKLLTPHHAPNAILFLMLSFSPLGCVADRFIIPPNHEKIAPGLAHQQIVYVDHRPVECWIARSPGARLSEPAAFVLYFVGKGDRADRWIGAVAGAWGKKPVEVWGMNYPGSGGTAGRPNLAAVGPDALGVYDQVKTVAGGRPIFVEGGSFGTTAALCVAARRPVAGVVLQNPPPLRQLIMGQYGWWNLWLLAGPVALQIPSDLDSVANAKRCKAPAIFILSGADELIPPRFHQMVLQEYAGPKQVIDMPGAKHGSPLTREAAERRNEEIDKIWNQAMEPQKK